MDRIHLPVTSNEFSEPMRNRIMEILATVSDPEIPVLSVIDLGIIRDISVRQENESNDPEITLQITPTYTGCPAIDTIKISIRMALLEAGFKKTHIIEVLSPAWTTDWITEKGRENLKAYGIAPPHYQQSVCSPDSFQKEEAIQCPLCNSYHTRLVSQFGSTACKALYQCNDCKEPFDYFKCH